MLSPKIYQFLVGVFASMGSVLFGYDLGVIAEVIASETFVSFFNKPTPTQTGIVVSFFTGGAFCGAGLAGPCGDKLGRRWTIVIGCIIYLIGGAFQTGAANISYLMAGRWLAGLGVGFLVMIIPLYQAEIAHPSIRGTITALQQFMLGIGAFVAGWVSYGTYVGIKDSTAQWRVPLAIQLIPAIVLGALIFLFPESPRWLMDNGKPEEGLKTLARLHSNGDVNDPWVQAEFDQIQASITHEHENEAKSYLELFTDRSCFRRLLIACALQASVQMTGVSAIQYYSVKIYGQIGIDGANALKYQAINNIIGLLGEGACVVFIDRLGRRRPLISGNLFNMVCFLVACILIAQFPPGVANNKAASWGFIICTWAYNFSFSATCGPLSWIIPAEIFDTKTRSKGVSIATMVSFAFNTMIGQITDVAMTNLGYRYYFLFIICNFTNALFFYLLLPETKNLPLEEMNYLFTNAPYLVAFTDKKTYNAGYADELERRALEIQEKGQVVEHIN
ncbi:MFS general substrate transporter [Glarea lozoyensis ATCC 20868]|uniref:MFS general substrate transporter n=1 Tax=Glarea lozoyensis (strain ATCC 20868 / MF5171) TaxID=1116229 RepID=S3DWB0_GLAL2|nr:MFS general substrate transporter [Glarea lozoyensis ATCC 20868]EPE30673.1 MFS general substrate transporter [Glarea lozoyensis ATCC 20868]